MAGATGGGGAFGLSAADQAVALASLGATAKLLSSIGIGSLAAQRNILDANAISVLSRLVYWTFQPAFLLTSVCKTLHSASAVSAATTSAGAAGAVGLSPALLALMPLTALIQIGIGNVLGRVVTSGIQIDDATERRDVTMCTTFGNSGPLPLLFSDALFAGSAIRTDVAACISFYLLTWSPLFWSYGKIILGTVSLGGGSGSGSNGGDDASLNENTNGKTIRKKREHAKALFKLVFSPPVTGAMLGLFIGSIPPLRKSFMGGILSPVYGALSTLGSAYLPAAMLVLAGSLVGKREPSKRTSKATTTTTTSTSSSSSTTTTTTTPTTSSPSKTSTKPTKPKSFALNTKRGPSLKAILAILVSRFAVAPLLVLAVVQTLSKWNWIGPMGSRTRAIVMFTLLMEGCMPPAQNSVVLLQLEGLRGRATRMAKLLTIIYSISVIPITILLSACLGYSGILKFV